MAHSIDSKPPVSGPYVLGNTLLFMLLTHAVSKRLVAINVLSLGHTVSIMIQTQSTKNLNCKSAL
ncbi:hypothetical protein S4054249_20515 [Pseudoalteromonas luteoviolacea]|uniref:Uncharacterized protein n=1 Tax=Pseudoalteromonas luteoviolacea S4054 TaxID=1129367 RepID=A0A0F6AHL5_9GAMM|nr:hypothetical protein S4054249_20515 [Pseudoalteromonas luteoviolacea]AOT14961.1 hypothetical protein S40542_20485 [Pseudoalteromonas luteoviolacea]AOT19877.1 hypothetical protein S4054_20490 [Pseudoalteromonas luteoviolacea]KKE84864.1 hypothetical protein N479_07140 [Pseudoalteromonas luteoviolacea S4054]KZN72481.1 hypothetical protein N481_14730 [Pseudoalteromonas luteoviolacea S4047-1]